MAKYTELNSAISFSFIILLNSSINKPSLLKQILSIACMAPLVFEPWNYTGYNHSREFTCPPIPSVFITFRTSIL